MTHHPEPTGPEQVEGLRAFGDALAEGRSNPATNEVEATMLRTQHALGADRLAASAIPGSVKQTIWEDLMHAQPSTANPPVPIAQRKSARAAHRFGSNSVVIPGVRGIHSLPRPDTSRLGRTVMRWQPAVSLGVVIAFLIGLIGIAYQRGVMDDSAAPTGSYQVGLGAATPESTQPFGECESNGGTQSSDDDLRTMSITDWPVPAYVVAQPVPPDIGQRVASTYLGYQACLFERFESGSDQASPEELSYLSDRMRFVLLYDTLGPEQQAEIEARRDRDPIPRMISDFPLPLNRTDFNFVEISSGSFTTDFFLAGDVYALPDGRYAAIIGGVSTHMLRTGQPIRSGDGELYFVAFAEHDGAFFIDETFTICPSDFALDAEEAGTAPSTPDLGLGMDVFVTPGPCSG